MVRLDFEIREAGGQLHGTILQEGRAATGGRAEVFAPGSVKWPSSGVGIATEHYGAEEVRAFPHRTNDGRIEIRARATDAIKQAIDDGKKYMSVEFVALQERTTDGGIREIQSALVDKAALVEVPEYDSTRAEIRSKRRRRIWL